MLPKVINILCPINVFSFMRDPARDGQSKQKT